jgi:hypothetical protein
MSSVRFVRTGSTRRTPTSADSGGAGCWRYRRRPGLETSGLRCSNNEYIRKTAEPIDENARRAGAFEEVGTVTPAAGVTTDWTHLRIFRLKSMAAAEALGAALDAATARVVPDEATRKANSERSATLRFCATSCASKCEPSCVEGTRTRNGEPSEPRTRIPNPRTPCSDRRLRQARTRSSSAPPWIRRRRW